MHASKLMDSHPLVSLYGGSNRCHNIADLLLLFVLEWCWSEVFFPSFMALMMRVNLAH
jgi:hypothetical protein